MFHMKKKQRSLIISMLIFLIFIILVIVLPSSNKPPSSLQTYTSYQSAPDFSLKCLERGITLTKATFYGKPLIMIFTTTYCTPCIAGLQELAKYYMQVKGKFNVLLIFIDPNEKDSDIINYKAKYAHEDWFVAKDSDQQIVKLYNVKYLDTKIIIDKNGIIRYVDLQILTFDRIKSMLDPLIN